MRISTQNIKCSQRQMMHTCIHHRESKLERGGRGERGEEGKKKERKSN